MGKFTTENFISNIIIIIIKSNRRISDTIIYIIIWVPVAWAIFELCRSGGLATRGVDFILSCLKQKESTAATSRDSPGLRGEDTNEDPDDAGNRSSSADRPPNP